MTPAIAFVVDALATYRLTRLVTADTLTEGPRREVVKLAYDRAGRRLPDVDWYSGEPTGNELVAADPDAPKVAYLVTCPWCSGVYVAAGVAIMRALMPRPWQGLARVLALSAAAGLLAHAEDR